MTSLPKPVLRELRDLVLSLLKSEDLEVDVPRLEKLDMALSRALKPSRAVVASRKRREVKQAARREVSNALRSQVVKRAEGRCEACGSGSMGLEVDHFFGGRNRRSLESKETVWCLCRTCHRNKTDNKPSAAYWLRAFVQHTQKHEYGDAWQLAVKRLLSLEAQGRAA